jgi:hypothetical protein
VGIDKNLASLTLSHIFTKSLLSRQILGCQKWRSGGQIADGSLGEAKRYAAFASRIRWSRDLQVLLQDLASARPMKRVPQTTHFLAVRGTFARMELFCLIMQAVEQYLL